jgi:predicted Zn finger-like uncharacterized protein
MKITCQSCQAKYTIADDKVLGKIVKIRCKKCSETIVVNGSDPSGASGYTPEPAGAYGGADEAWTVNVAEGDQRTMTDVEVVAAYQAGIVGDETYCWKDGMGDWLPLREIDQLVDACNATRAIVSASIAPEPNPARVLHNAPAAGAAYASGGNGSSANAFPQAARRAGGRAGADLFRGAAQAGSEEEVMTSAPTHTPEARDEKPTGARNENSVLFSLAALTSKGQSDRPAPMPGSEQSGLIDIRQLSAQMGQITEKKQSRVDDIMNLTSGSAYNQALSAPVLSAPALDQYGAGPDAGGGSAGAGKSRTLIFAVIGGAFIIAAGVGATVMFARGGDTAGADTAASASSAAASAGSRVATVLGAGSASAAAAPSASAPSATSTAVAAAAAAPASATAAPAAAATDSPAAHPAAQAPAAAAAAPKAAAPAAAAAAPKAAAPAAAPEADQPFNMGEAKAKLAAAAAAVQACKKGDGPAGTGRVVVLFAPSGAAQSATVSGAPFEGTPTGACVAARFRGVHVPAFSGSPFSVSKSFTIN